MSPEAEKDRRGFGTICEQLRSLGWRTVKVQSVETGWWVETQRSVAPAGPFGRRRNDLVVWANGRTPEVAIRRLVARILADADLSGGPSDD